MTGLRSSAARAQLLTMGAIGLDVEQLQERAGLDPDLLADPDAYVPLSVMGALWEHAMAAHGGRDLGLRLGAAVPAGAIGIVDYLILTHATVGGALDAFVRYSPLVTTAETYRVEVVGGQAAIVWERSLDASPYPDCARDYVLAHLVTRFRALGPGGRVVAVRLEGGPFAPEATYPEILGCPVHFFEPRSKLLLLPGALEMEIPRRDDQLNRVLERHAIRLLDDAPSADVVERATREAQRALLRGSSSVGGVAKRLGMSARTLQRRLAEHDVAFSELLDRARLALARRHLDDPTLSIEEIAFLLGYAERRSFSRAFRRWTGRTPADYRGRRGARAPRDRPRGS